MHATAVAAILTGRTNREVTVHLPGGDLRVEWNRQSGHVFMTGELPRCSPAKYRIFNLSKSESEAMHADDVT